MKTSARSFPLIAVLLFLFISNGYSWDYELASKTQIQSVVADSSGQNIIVDCFHGGLWTTVDGGTSWQAINSRFNTHEKISAKWIICSELDCAKQMVLTLSSRGPALFGTDNGGATWEYRHDPNDENYYLNRNDVGIFSRYYENRIYMMGNGVLAVSDDNCLTWDDQIVTSPRRDIIEFKEDIFSDTVLYASTYYRDYEGEYVGGFFRSIRSGDGWSLGVPIIDLYQEYGITSCSVPTFCQMSNGEFIVSVDENAEDWLDNNLIILDNGLNVFSRTGSDLDKGFVAKKIVEDCEISGRLYALDDKPSRLFISNDYGRNWEPCSGNGFPGGWQCFNSLYQNIRSGDIYIASKSFGLYKSSNNAANWEKIPDPPIGPDGLIGLFDDYVFVTDRDQVNQWILDEDEGSYSSLVLPEEENVQSNPRTILYVNGDTLVTFTENYDRSNDYTPYYSILHSYDAGENWTTICESAPIYGLAYEPVTSCDEGSRLIATYGSSPYSICYSEDLGVTWSTIDLSAEGVTGLTYYLNIDGENIYIPVWFSDESDKLYRYNVRTQELEDMEYPCVNGSIDHPFIRVYGDSLYVAMSDGSFHVYDGFDWYEKTTLPGGKISGLTIIPSDTPVFISSVVPHHALYLSRDFGETWTYTPLDHDDIIQNTQVLNPQYDPWRNRVWIETGLGPMWLDADELVNSMGVDPVETHPVEIDVISCYPNPFNASARIKFKVQHPGIVTLRLYDITGRLVEECLHDYKAAGEHEYYINAIRLASGTYFARLDMNHQAYVEKITLVK